ncbi:hypothetical protein IFM89_024066, partial [Coptis chinensis]
MYALIEVNSTLCCLSTKEKAGKKTKINPSGKINPKKNRVITKERARERRFKRSQILRNKRLGISPNQFHSYQLNDVNINDDDYLSQISGTDSEDDDVNDLNPKVPRICDLEVSHT